MYTLLFSSHSNLGRNHLNERTNIDGPGICCHLAQHLLLSRHENSLIPSLGPIRLSLLFSVRSYVVRSTLPWSAGQSIQIACGYKDFSERQVKKDPPDFVFDNRHILLISEKYTQTGAPRWRQQAPNTGPLRLLISCCISRRFVDSCLQHKEVTWTNKKHALLCGGVPAKNRQIKVSFVKYSKGMVREDCHHLTIKANSESDSSLSQIFDSFSHPISCVQS